MQLPPELHDAIQSLLEGISLSEISKHFHTLSSDYRNQNFAAPPLKSPLDYLAYLAFRLPATYGAIVRAFQEIDPSEKIESCLDLGAGPGAGGWAATTLFANIQKITFFERDPQWIKIGKELASSFPPLNGAHWERCDLTQLGDIPPHDLTLLAYVIGEIDERRHPRLLQTVWEKTNKVCLIIEPGTPKGFSRIGKIRQFFLSLHAPILAPCPHENRCPIVEGDWCHFAQRIERSSLHRKIKSGSLGFEDEKFTYLALCKTRFTKPPFRILRPPLKQPGLIQFTVCSSQGIQKLTYSRKEKTSFKDKKKLSWGDSF